jgi:hypothetical protein
MYMFISTYIHKYTCRYSTDPEGEVEINYGNQTEDEMLRNVPDTQDFSDPIGNIVKNEVVVIKNKGLNDQCIRIDNYIPSSSSSSSSSSFNQPSGEPSIESSSKEHSVEHSSEDKFSKEISSVETSKEHSSTEPSKESSTIQPSSSSSSSTSSTNHDFISSDSKLSFLVVNTNLTPNPYALSPASGGAVRQVVSSQGCSRNFIVKGMYTKIYMCLGIYICVFTDMYRYVYELIGGCLWMYI